MASFLDFLGGALPFAGNAVASYNDGKQLGFEDRLAQQQEAIRARQAEEDRKAKRQLDALNRRNIESQISTRDNPTPETRAPRWQVDLKRGVRINADTGEVAPLEGLPEVPQTPAQQKPRTQVIGGQIVDLDSGTARDIAGLTQPEQAGQDRTTAATRTRIAEGTAQLDLIRRAREGLRRYPNAVGISRGLGALPGMGLIGDAVNQRADPQGVAVRQDLANLASMTIKDRSGAAVTISEFPRLAAFIPNVYDTPEKIQSNLDALERELQIVLNALQNGATLDELRGGASPVSRGTPNASPAPSFAEWQARKRGGTP